MALKKQVEQPSGHTSEYHKIIEMNLTNGGNATLIIEVYKDMTARIADKAPAAVRIAVMKTPPTSLADAYAWLKANDAVLKDSTDC